MSTHRVAVVGAGITGLAVARELAPDHEVTVFDSGGVAADTSSRASGVISLALEPFPDRWTEFVLRRFRALDGTGTFSFEERPTVRLVPTSDADRFADEAPEGGEFLDVDTLETRFPDAFADLSDYAGGVVYDRTGFVDVADYAATLKWAAEREGARIYRDHAVTDIVTAASDADGSRAVTGVETQFGEFETDYVVWATGWRTRDLLARYLELPVRPMRWNAVVVRPESPLPRTSPMGSEPATRTYWRPTRHGDVLVGGNEHLVDDPDAEPPIVDDAFVEEVRERIGPLLPGVQGGDVVRTDCCPSAEGATPDGLPIVDAPLEGPDNLVVACGTHGRGVMLSPLVGRVVRSNVTGESAGFPTDELSLSRFTDRAADFPYRSHWDA
jgi:sarcosine oxidase subunit beta